MVCSDFYDFKGKTVLITGASSGLGERFATILSSAGAKVILAARRKDKLQEVAGKIKNAAIIQLDVANPGSVKEAFEKINKENEQVDICINAAGVAKLGYVFAEKEEDIFNEAYDVNVKGLWLVTKAVANHMKDNKIQGSIINIGSVSGDAVPAIGGAAYCSAKASVHQLTKTLYNLKHLIFLVTQTTLPKNYKEIV